MLNRCCVFYVNKSTGREILSWKFKELPDNSFNKLYPNIVEKTEELFKGLKQRLSGFTSNAGKHKFGKSAEDFKGV